MKTICAAIVMAASAYADTVVQHQQQHQPHYTYAEQRSDDTILDAGEWVTVPHNYNPYQPQPAAKNPFE